MNQTPSANRIHIGFFGLRNAGKSTLVNAITNQEMSVVSGTAGTTTDPVQKSMEILPLGPVLIIDTPGIDDEGMLGEKRVKRTRQILATTDIAVLVTDATKDMSPLELKLVETFKEKQIPYVIVKNKTDVEKNFLPSPYCIAISAKDGRGIEELKKKLASFAKEDDEIRLVADLLPQGATALLVVPIDKSAPKGRLILPQQQVIRNLLDHGMTSIVVRDDALDKTLSNLGKKPDIVICDSQVFGKVAKIVPQNVPLTSFSILMARAKGFLSVAVDGAKKIGSLTSSDKVLICEGCTHHRQCEDIGTVKLPAWIREYTGSEPSFEFTSGTNFPEDLSSYSLIIHCGGCMITEKEVTRRMRCAQDAGIPFTNYGTAIAYIKGILNRSTEIFEL